MIKFKKPTKKTTLIIAVGCLCVVTAAVLLIIFSRMDTISHLSYNEAISKADEATESNNYNKAVQYYNQAIAVASTDKQKADVYYSVAEIQSLVEDFTNAIANYQQAASYFKQLSDDVSYNSSINGKNQAEQRLQVQQATEEKQGINAGPSEIDGSIL